MTNPKLGASPNWYGTQSVPAILDEVELLEEHSHNVERWWGAVAVPDEENAIAATVTVPFAAVSGDDAWGDAIPILGAADNPVLAGMTTFDLHRILVMSLDDEVDAWRLRVIWGTGTSGQAIAAGQWTEVMVTTNVAPGNRSGGDPIALRMPVVPVGIKAWVQAWNDTLGEVLQFYYGAHGYPYPP